MVPDCDVNLRQVQCTTPKTTAVVFMAFVDLNQTGLKLIYLFFCCTLHMCSAVIHMLCSTCTSNLQTCIYLCSCLKQVSGKCDYTMSHNALLTCMSAFLLASRQTR